MRWLTGYDVSSTSHPAGAPMAHERPESLTFGRLVVEQRRRLSLSQTDVARRVRNAAKAEGRQSGTTKQWVSEIERRGGSLTRTGCVGSQSRLRFPSSDWLIPLISRSVLV